MPRLREPDPSGSIEEYIGDLVRNARAQLGWTQVELAGKVFSNKTRISEVELGDDPPDLDLALKLESVLGVPRGSLSNLVRILNQENVRDYAKQYLKHQLEATSIHEFSLGIPGLLQTEGYARGAMAAGLAGGPAQIDLYVSERLERQAILSQAEPPWLVAIIDESALRRAIGGRDAMRKQVEHLLKMNEQPHINIQVLPQGGVAVAGSFTLLTRSTGQRTAYTEGFNTGSYIEDQREVQRFQRVYDLVQQGALGAHDSVELMHAVKEAHG
ncbi:Scr1 family TA system antitoxin-like transcriptional regulator [Streptomyces sp. C]|uniref:helix-turn-helix domain-containing protein n=1 Tax=Streptomyces TaxID=1883 RepID=UPI0001B56C71|nr:Scr1 family TA system antitoxin-like transcriptional regulator [Streptomyces sp. C]EFL13882.1 predicted protein [Streptomyces sp. C]